jgi:hypothetical protein
MNQAAVKLETARDADILTFPKLTSPLLWLAGGKINPSFFIDELLGGQRGNRLTSIPTLGIQAAKTGQGTRPDGSVHYGLQVFEPVSVNSEQRDAWNSQLVEFRIRGGRPIEPRNIEALKTLVNSMEDRGSHVIVFIPPVAPSVRDAIARDPKANEFVEGFRRKTVAALGSRVFDFHGLVPDGDDDCEFIDGFHGGEVTYLRILKSMAAKDTVLAPLIDRDAIDAAISGFKGHALAILDPKAYFLKESDFLGIGCAK